MGRGGDSTESILFGPGAGPARPVRLAPSPATYPFGARELEELKAVDEAVGELCDRLRELEHDSVADQLRDRVEEIKDYDTWTLNQLLESTEVSDEAVSEGERVYARMTEAVGKLTSLGHPDESAEAADLVNRYTHIFDKEAQKICAGSADLDPGRCQAVIWNGPGHQSKAKCQLEGEHEIHSASPMGIELCWRGDEGFTTSSDESPL